MIKPIQVVPYDPQWPQLFKQEATFLREILGDVCIEIHHIGSTAIPGLAAKRDLDVICVVDSLSSSLILKNHGYVFKGELNIPLRYYFSKNTIFSKVNLHVLEADHGFIALNMCFRDYLRTHELACLDYATLKADLLKNPKSHEKQAGRFSGYNLGKDIFIKSILDKAGFEGLTLNFCLHDREWDAYHRIRIQQIFEPLGIGYDNSHPKLVHEGNFHFVLYKGSQVVSTAHVERLNDNEMALRCLATDGSCQNAGYGAYLLKLLEEWIGEQGARVIKMHSFSNAVPFYQKHGYQDMPFIEQTPTHLDYVHLGKVLVL